MKLPWGKKAEHRAADYTDAIINHALATAKGDTVSGLTAVLEVCGGWWGRAFTSAEIQPAGAVANLLIPHLGTIGRALVVDGEILFAVDIAGDTVSLLPATGATVTGGPNPSTWEYEVSIPGPSHTLTRTLPADRVLHLMFTPSRKSPWRGMSPIEASGTTKALIDSMETRLAEELNSGVGFVVPVPNIQASTQLQADLRALKGRLALVETVNQGFGVGQGGVPSGDYQVRRLGADPPESTVTLRRQTEESILAACGLPVSILGTSSDTAAREGVRMFMRQTIRPVAKAVAAVVAAKFDVPELTFAFEESTADLQAKSRSFAVLAQAGLPIEKALENRYPARELMPFGLDIVIRQTRVIPPATLTFRYADAVAADTDVDTAGEYKTGTAVIDVALVDSDGTAMLTLPVGTVLTFSGRNPLNLPITVDRTVTAYSAGADRVTIGLSGDAITNHGAIEFSAALPGTSDTKQFWAKRLDFTASYLAAQVGLGLVSASDTRYRVRPNPAWVLAATFEDEKGDERTVVTVSQSEDRKFLELLASRVAG